MMTMQPQVPERRLRVLLCGYGHLGLALLQGMLECPELCEVVGVFRWISRPGSEQCYEPIEDVFQTMVTSSGVRDIVCPGINSYEFTTILQELQPDVVLVGSWGEIIKSHMIDREDLLLVNCHPSKLPAHRGANPYASVIEAQENETGVTFHRIAKKIDAGAILLQQTVALTMHDTGMSIRDKCSGVAYQMTKEMVLRLYNHCIHKRPIEEWEQPQENVAYYPALKTEDGLIDWENAAEVLYRQYRRLFPWFVCYSHLDGKRLINFFDMAFVPRPDNVPSGKAAGTILSFNKGILYIAVADEQWVMVVSLYQIAYQVAGWSGYLPFWLGKLVAPLLFWPGRQFRTGKLAAPA